MPGGVKIQIPRALRRALREVSSMKTSPDFSVTWGEYVSYDNRDSGSVRPRIDVLGTGHGRLTLGATSGPLSANAPRQPCRPGRVQPNPTPMNRSSERARIVRMIARLPQARAVPYATHLSLEIRKRRFGWFLEDHHGDGRLAIHCKASAKRRERLRAAVPQQLHAPKHVGHHGWVGLWLDLATVDWSEVESTLLEAYRMTAPASLAAGLRDEAIAARSVSRHFRKQS